MPLGNTEYVQFSLREVNNEAPANGGNGRIENVLFVRFFPGEGILRKWLQQM